MVWTSATNNGAAADVIMSSHRLLEGLQRILINVRDVCATEATQAGLIVDELLLREQLPSLRHHYAAGYQLVRSRFESHAAETQRLAAYVELFSGLPALLSEESNWQSCREQIGRLMECASAIAESTSYPTQADKAFDTVVSELLAWEVRGYRFAEVPTAAAPETKLAISAEHVRNALREIPGYEDASITSFEPLLGGVSKVTIGFEALSARQGKERFVLRGESLLPILDQVYLGMELANEYNLLHYLHRAGAPVAEVIALVDDRRLAPGRFFVSRWIPGRPPGDYLLRVNSVSPALSARVATILADLHNIPVDLKDPDLARTHLVRTGAKTREDAVREFVLRAHAYWKSSGAPASPMISTAVRWLLENVPASSKAACIIHSDCGLNNFLVKEDEISAVVDWETARLGDPAEDVVWFMFATGHVLDQDHFLRSYVQAGGERVNAFTRKYFEVLARVRVLFAQVDVQIKYERVPSANVILCAMALGQADKTVADLDAAIRAADEVKRQSSTRS